MPIIPNKRSAFESVRTLIGNENQVTRELGLPYTMKKNSTLNELFTVNNDVALHWHGWYQYAKLY